MCSQGSNWKYSSIGLDSGLRRSGDKPFSEPMMVSLLTQICVTRPQWVNSFVPRRSGFNCKTAIFKLVLLNQSFWLIPHMNVTRPYWWKFKTGSGDGLVPSGNKPLPGQMLTQIYVAIWGHWGTMSWCLKASHNFISNWAVCSKAYPAKQQRNHENSAWLVLVAGTTLVLE